MNISFRALLAAELLILLWIQLNITFRDTPTAFSWLKIGGDDFAAIDVPSLGQTSTGVQRKGSNTHHIPSMLVRTMDREPAPGEVRAEYVHDISNHEQAARESSIDVDFFPVKTEIEDQMDVKDFGFNTDGKKELEEMLALTNLSLPAFACKGLNCCTEAKNETQDNLCPNIEWKMVNASHSVKWLSVPPTFVHKDPAHAVAVTLGQVPRSYLYPSENEVRFGAMLLRWSNQAKCNNYWKMVFRTVEFMGTQGETCDSPDAILSRVNTLYSSMFHYPPDKTGPVRRYWMMMLSFTPMEHRPQMVLMIEAEASYAHPGSDVAPHRIELVRRLYYTGGLQPRKEIVSSSLHMIRKPPVVNILLANYQSGVMLEQFVHLLRMYYRCSGDRYFRLVVVDASPSYFGVEDILERSQIPYRLVVVKPPFLRAGLLNMAANATYTPMRLDLSSPNIISTTISANDVKDDDDSILLMFDLSITYPMEWLWRIRGLVVKGLRLYAPEVFRTRYGAPARVSLSEAEGKTETEGYGILAVHRDDFERYYFDADKFKHKWGGEDVDLVGRMVVTNRKIGIVRTRGEHVVHIWHPPFNNTKWYESFTTGAKIQVPHHMKCVNTAPAMIAGKVHHEAASAFYDSMPPLCQLQTKRPHYSLSICDDKLPSGKRHVNAPNPVIPKPVIPRPVVPPRLRPHTQWTQKEEAKIKQLL